MKTKEKRFPADTKLDISTFLDDKKVDGELYAFLQGLSTHDKNNTYTLKKNLPIQTEICKVIGIKSPKTLRAHLAYLINQGFVVEQEDRYLLPLQEDIYFLMPLKTLQFLLDNCKEHVIKIYIYLGQRWKWSQGRGESYNFTYRDIAKHIGLNTLKEDAANRKIKNALELLTMAELVDYENVYINKLPYKKLTNFSFDYKDIKK